MAGMLPGVESARRRRFHGSGGWSESPSAGVSSFGSIRRSSFCHSTPSLQRGTGSKSYHDDERLEGVAREAKERLDERLRVRPPWKSQPQRVNKQEMSRGVVASVEERREKVVEELQTEVFGLKKSGSTKRLLNWAKMSWKASDQDECTVCLDHFKVGETLAHLPCAHRFHSRCLVPWLENNAHCPCCRMVLASN